MVYKSLIFGILALSMSIHVNAETLYPLNSRQQNRFDTILNRYRCIVCQGQPLSDAENPISLSIKNKIVELIQQGKSDNDIDDYLVQRYGDYIRFMPRVNMLNSFLWLGPVCILVFLITGIRKRYYGQLTERFL